MSFSFPLFAVPIATFLVYVPHAVRVVIARKAGTYDNKNPRDNTKLSDIPDKDAELQKRLLGAHQNQLETIGVFAAGIVANVARKEENWLINFLAALYIGCRVAYIVLYAAPPYAGGYLRTLAFFLCFSTIMAIWVRAFV